MRETPRRIAVCGAFLMPGRKNDASDAALVQPSRPSRQSCSGRSTGANAAAPVSGLGLATAERAASAVFRPVAAAAVRAAIAVISEKGAASALPSSSFPFATAQRHHARSLFASLV
jgi:hypothetical protein